MLTAAGAVALTKPDRSNLKRDAVVFLQFKGTTTPLSTSELTNPSEWTFLGTNPGPDCGGSELPCVVGIDSTMLNSQPGSTKEDKMASFLDSQMDDGIQYIDDNTKFEKDPSD